MTMISLPTVSEYIAGIASWASGLFSETLAVVWIPIGIAVATGVLWFVARTVTNGLMWLFHRVSGE